MSSPTSHTTATIAGALIVNLLYAAFLTLILLSGHGREFLTLGTRWSAAIAAGLLAAMFGGCLGGFFVVTNDARKQDEKTALMLTVVFNGGVAVATGLVFARLINFSWKHFLDVSPQASALAAVTLLALALLGLGLYNSRNKTSNTT